MQNEIKIIEVGMAEIPVIIELAHDTWFTTYYPIIGKEQTDYMFGQIYTPDSLLRQMEFLKHRFFVLYDQGQAKGFASIGLREVQPTCVKLHKLYVLPNNQNKGFGKMLIEEMEKEAVLMGANTLELNVNRENKAKDFYEHLGYSIVREEDIPIGTFFMNDYVLGKAL